MFERLLVPVLLVIPFWIGASSIVAETRVPEMGTTQITLTNGMRLCLKPTSFESDEVLIRLTAEGGYASLPLSQRASGELAAQIAWESGLQGMSTDKLEALIYEHSIEVYAKVLPFHRIFEGTTDRGGIEVFFDLVNRYSTQKNFTQEGFDKVVKLVKAFLRERDEGRSAPFEEWSRLIHTQDITELKPIVYQDLEKMEYERSKQFFEAYFSNPADFVCVVVGDFQINELLPLINRYLGTIPIQGNKTLLPLAVSPTFPERTFTKRVAAPGEQESLARLTFPLAPIQNAQELRLAKFMAQVLETRLREVIYNRFGAALGLCVTYELPLYPSLDLTWIAIQYRSSPKLAEAVQKVVLDEIKLLVTEKSLTPDELACNWSQLKKKEELWQKDNHYWLTMLSDYFLRGWEWQEGSLTAEKEPAPSSAQLKQALERQLLFNRFTFIYTNP